MQSGTPNCGAEECCAEDEECVDGACQPVSPPACRDDKAQCCSGGLMQLDPVNMLSGKTLFRTKDVSISGTAGELRLLRNYVGDTSSWSHLRGVEKIPVPFGHAFGRDDTLRWWHNFFAYVFRVPTPWRFGVRDDNGQELTFEDCSATPFLPCFATPAANGIASRLLVTSSQGEDGGFVLYGPDGVELTFDKHYVRPNWTAGSGDPDPSVWFLGSVRTNGVPSAVLSYEPPGGLSCATGGTGSDYGVPYLKSISVPNSTTSIQFAYGYASLSDGGSECVLTRVEQVLTDGGIDVLAEYDYRSSRVGLLSSVTRGDVVEEYDYGASLQDGQPDESRFVRTLNGVQVLAHNYNGGRTSSAVVDSNAWSVVYASDGQATVCSGTHPTYVRAVQDVDAGLGTGADGISNWTRTFTFYDTDSTRQSRLASYSDSCTDNSCSPGTVTHQRSCSLPVEQGVQDKRGNWTAYSWASPPAGVPSNLYEKQAEYRGATQSDATGALETTNFTYLYAGDAKLQKVSTETRPSVVAGGDSVATAQYFYGADGGFVAREFRTGDTTDLAGTALPKVIGTFRFTSHQRAPGGGLETGNDVLEVHGPCEVSSTSVSDCSGTSYPVTANYFYDAPGTNEHGRPWKEVRYSGADGGLGTALTTTYLAYDSRGRMTQVSTPTGVVTSYTFGDDGVTSAAVQTGGGAVTRSFGYDNGKLAWVHHPEGNYDVYCYRPGATLGACNGSTFSPRLAWRAKSSSQTGGAANISELVAYTYWPDGTVREEASYSYYPDQGETQLTLRRKMKYAVDAHRRPTFQQAGSTPAATRGYDGADNLAAIGISYNSPPAFCKDGAGAHDPRCTKLTYDRADRLLSVEEYPTTSSTPVKTCFGHDAVGNITTVVHGCQTTTSCEGTDGQLNLSALPASCQSGASTYVYDDFGRLVASQVANTEGQQRFVYDALGDVLSEQTPEQLMAGDGAYLARTYDALGRKTSETLVLPGATDQPLFEFTYDSDPSARPLSCPAPASALLAGLLSSRQDSFGLTYYDYDEFGRVVHEYRVRDLVAGCGDAHSDGAPHTDYSYTQNGEVSQIVYPHGRVVTFSHYAARGLQDRVASISASLLVSGSWQTTELVRKAAWEPFGGLRGYELIAPRASAPDNVAAVEYYLGNAADSTLRACNASNSTVAGTLDDSGRLKGLRVSRAAFSFGGGTGDVLDLRYSWAGDQVNSVDECLLDDSASMAQRTLYHPDQSGTVAGYDQLPRLTNVRNPGNTTTSTPNRSYSYSERGNCTSSTEECWSFEHDYAQNASYADRMVEFRSSNGLIDYTFDYDRDGRVKHKGWNLSQGFSTTRAIDFIYSVPAGAAPNGNGAAQTVYRRVELNGLAYEYFYDAENRRRLKVYPAGVADEYFYDNGHQMLEDRGSYTVTTGAPYPIDEYIWLGGRPIAFIRSSFDSGWHRQNDFANTEFTCQRNGVATPCGVYFIITDHISKPVMTIDSHRRVSGAAEYDPFGFPNRIRNVAANLGYPNWTPEHPETVLAYGSVPVPSPLVAKVRARLYNVDTEGCAKTNPQGSLYDVAFISNLSGEIIMEDGASAWIGGHDLSSVASGWAPVPASGQFALRFRPDSTNCAPNPGDCAVNKSSCTPYTYAGVTLEWWEYERYETNATPVFTPLRFPGQYYDEETDLFENWNRYYDPMMGRYLQPEPLLQHPSFIKQSTWEGKTLPAYGYAFNNPIAYIDPDGLDPGCTNTYDCCIQRHPGDPEACGGEPPVRPPEPPKLTCPPYCPPPIIDPRRQPDECPIKEAATGKGRWQCTAQCNVQGIPGIAPDNLVSRVTGEGRGKTEAEACKNAQHDANQYVPSGAYKRHCQCDCASR